ncbi:MAG: chaperone NapD [Kiloniellales bacterium]|nr:chaperone NapD [Kiloniellales bacterium]
MTSSTEIHIASLLVQGFPESLPAISRKIEALAGAEVHSSHPTGKLIVTLETENESEILKGLNVIQSFDGVLSAALIYHEVDEDTSQTEGTQKP